MEEDYNNSIGQCDRCQETVEPIVTPQWYVKTEKLAKRAAKAVETNEIEIKPSRFIFPLPTNCTCNFII